VDELGLGEMVELPGFVATERVHELMAGAMCVVLPSRREGYGLVVIEAAAFGTPSVVVSAPDNAATELVVDGENGFIAASASPEDLAAAIVRVSRAGSELRRSTADWFAANARRLGIDGSLETVARSYRG
jgi:glycosyltransferase involved in cell wall biosynthesis